MGGVEQSISSTSILSKQEHEYNDFSTQHRQFLNLFDIATTKDSDENEIRIPDDLIDSILVNGLIDSGAGFFAMPNDCAQKLDSMGLKSLLSTLVGKNADGQTSKSAGKYNARFFYGITDETIIDDANSICLQLESYGRNAFIIIPVIRLAQQKFRLISCEEEILGTYFITPSNDWYKCRVERNVPFLDLKMDIYRDSVTQKSKLVVSIAQQPDFHYNFESLFTSKFYDSLPINTSIPSDTSVTMEPINDLYDQIAPANEYDFHPSIIYDNPTYFSDLDIPNDVSCAPAIDTTSNIQKRTRNKGRFSQNPQKTIEAQSQLFGCPGPRKLSRLSRYLKGVRQFKGYYQNNANFNALTGFHPLTRVPRNIRSDRQFVPYACCTFDFERLWPQPDAEGFRTSCLFMDIVTRFSYSVLLHSYKEFLDAFKEYESFIFTTHQVTIVYFYGDSDRTWQSTDEIREAKTLAFRYMEARGTKVHTSPPNTHQLNHLIETRSGIILHLMNRFLMTARLSTKVRGRAWLHANLISNLLPGPPDVELFSDGENSWYAFYGEKFDITIIPGPFGCSIMTKVIGTKSGQCVRCSKAGIFVGVSSNSSCIIGFILESKKTVRVYHFVAQPDLSRRSALLLASDDLWNSQSAPVSPTLELVQKGIREIFQDIPIIDRERCEILIDPLTHLPVKYEPYDDDDGNLYLLPTDQPEPKLLNPPPVRSDITPRNRDTPTRVAADAARTNISRQLTVSDPSDIVESDDDTEQLPLHTPNPENEQDIRLSKLKALNRYHPVMKPIVKFIQSESKVLRSAPLDTKLKFMQYNPKTKDSASFIRYERYKAANNLSRFYELGGTRGDLVNDMERGFCQIHSVQTYESLPKYVSFLLDHSVCDEPFADTIEHMNHVAPGTHEFIRRISGRSEPLNTTNDQKTKTKTDFILREEPMNSATRIKPHEEERYSMTQIEGSLHDKGCTLKDFTLMNFEGAPKSCLYPEARDKFPIKIREGISCRDSTFEKQIEDPKTNTKTNDNSSNPVNSIYEHNGFVPMGKLLSEMSSLISEKFVDVFEHIRELEGRPDFKEADYTHQIMMNLLNSAEGQEIFDICATKTNPNESRWPKTVKKCFEEKVDWPKWKTALLDEWTKFMTVFNAADIISKEEFHEYKKSADYKGLIPVRWVNVVKFNGNRFKSRLVIAQTRHRFEVDNHWSPTLSLETLRLLICIATVYDAKIEQCDVLGAYLTVKLDPREPPILVKIPDGLDRMDVKYNDGELRWTDSKGNEHTKKTKDGNKPFGMILNVACYGLRSASMYFIYSFFDFLTDKNGLNYEQSSVDPCLFWKYESEESFIFVGIYSDNAIIISKGEQLRIQFIRAFNTKYKESPDSDFGNHENVEFLSLQIKKRNSGNKRITSINSPKLIQSLTENLKDRSLLVYDSTTQAFVTGNFLQAHVHTALPYGYKEILYAPVSDQNPEVPTEIFNCSQTLGILLWITLAWRFDALYECALYSKLIHYRKTINVCNGLKRLGFYILDNDDSLTYSANIGDTLELAGFSDASFCNGHELETYVSYIIRLCGGTLIGRTKSISAVMRCTRDSELYALMSIIMVIIGLRLMLAEMGLLKKGPTPVYVDNTSVLDGLNNKKVDRTQRYSEIRRGWVRKQVEDLLVSIMHCRSESLIADSGTKSHNGPAKHNFRRILLGIQQLDQNGFNTLARRCNTSSYADAVTDDDLLSIHSALIDFCANTDVFTDNENLLNENLLNENLLNENKTENYATTGKI